MAIELVGESTRELDFSDIGEKIQESVKKLKETEGAPVIGVVTFIINEKGGFLMGGSLPDEELSALICHIVSILIEENFISSEDTSDLMNVISTKLNLHSIKSNTH